MSKAINKTFIVRDLRQKSKYSIDDEYLNGYAKLCGVFGTAVYNSLCRHASKDQECFPSIELIAEQHNIGRKSVMNGLKNLKIWGIVEIIRERDEKSKRLKNNVYILLDKSQWKQKPSPCEGLRAKSLSGIEPSPCEAKSQVPVRDCKDTHIKDSQLRNVASATDGVENKNSEEKKDRPMNLQQFIEWCGKSSQAHIRIIGDWAETTGPQFETVGQWEAYIKRYLRPARDLVPFSQQQLEAGFRKIKEAKYLDTVTLETLFKFITNAKIK